MKTPDTLNHQLASLLGIRHVKRLSEIRKLQNLWSDICGAMLANCSEPVSIEKGCLWLAVNHPSVTAHIRMLQPEILLACERKAKISGLSQVRTRIDLNAGLKRAVPRPKRKRISLSQKKEIVRDLQGVHSHKLRHAMFRARVSQEELSPND
ncbi:MAG: DUF721 domain-containing protein [Mariprofundaceae bacterium]|nr:DUF721 domain-containing protein [Mariprofundaceae bacterium]